MEIAAPNFQHLLAMTDENGTFEHADHAEPRREHGYCTDDVARVLLVVAREPSAPPDLIRLAQSSEEFLRAAQSREGTSRNRRSASGEWVGPYTTEDCWGRSIWAFGTAAARSTDEAVRSSAAALFARGVQVRSRWPRSMAFAALGAAELFEIDPANTPARDLLVDAGRLLDRPDVDETWRWGEPRLSYANAALAEATMAVGLALREDQFVETGLRRLQWLLDLETPDTHLSVTPVGGRERNERVTKFDQQPIEVAAMSDACVRALAITGDAKWRDALELCALWFMGINDVGVPMYDAATGGGYDGLTERGANQNQGAESTIALLTTLQHVRQAVQLSS